LGFVTLSDYKLRDTIAPGDGIVFWKQKPTNEGADGDVTAYYTRKGYYAYGLQVCTLTFSNPDIIAFHIDFGSFIRLFAMLIVKLL
jgi:hypothetical protein